LAALTVGMPTSSTAAPPAHRDGGCEYTANGLIGAKWRALGAERGPLGCPVEWEYDSPEGRPARLQHFAHGSIAFSPKQGGQLVIAGWGQGNTVHVQWGPTDPYHYGKFLVRFDSSQHEAPGGKAGEASLAMADGAHRVVVEGCDADFWTGTSC